MSWHNLTQSEIFKWYNHARGASHKLGGIKNVNRALSLLLSNEPRPYNTTIKSCDCDSRVNPCKHRVAEMIIYRALQNRAVEPAASTPQPRRQTRTITVELTTRDPWGWAEGKYNHFDCLWDKNFPLDLLAGFKPVEIQMLTHSSRPRWHARYEITLEKE